MAIANAVKKEKGRGYLGSNLTTQGGTHVRVWRSEDGDIDVDMELKTGDKVHFRITRLDAREFGAALTRLADGML